MKKKVLVIGGSGFVGNAVAEALRKDHQIITTAGHKETKADYCLTAADTELLIQILERENPEIVVSSIRGEFKEQMSFHSMLADWLARKDKRLLYISTANVFDGDMSRPWTENDTPIPKSDYGVFKRDCELMLSNVLGNRLIIFRPSTVWDYDCPRTRLLKEHSRSGEAHGTIANHIVNVAYAKQIGEYAKYVLVHDLSGIFHIGTTDMADYFDFEKSVCKAIGIKPPKFALETEKNVVYQAVLPVRREIPDGLQMTVEQVLSKLGEREAMNINYRH